MKKSISEYINTNYKDYSKYVLYNRAIPSVIDGFKSSQRKIFYLAKDQKNLIKTAALAGNLISQAGYNHGDAAGGNAASLMAQSYVGSNNIPLLDSKGSFGNRLINEPSATRYTYIKAAKILPYIFKDYDICLDNPDPENPEKLNYLPIIPTVLLNGIKGIAVGFATDIPAFDIYDLIEQSINYLENKKTEVIYPFYRGYEGILVEEDDKLILKGKFEILSTTEIRITEIPIAYDREKYISHLHSLMDKNLIISYDDSKCKQNWDIKVKIPRKSKVWDNIEKYFKLTQNINYNLTTIDENTNLKIFNSPNEILEYFVDFRITKFEKRRLKRIEEFTSLIEYNNNKIRFIEQAIEYDFKNKTKKKIYSDFKKDFIEEQLEKFLKMSIYSLNKDTIKDIKKKISEYKKELKYYQKITAKELYVLDLETLKTYCEKEGI